MSHYQLNYIAELLNRPGYLQTWAQSSGGRVKNRVHGFKSVVPNRGAAAPWGAIYSAQGCRGLTRFFYHIIKNTFSNCHQTSKQIAMGAVNYYSFL